MKVVPSYGNIDPASLSDKDLAIITQNGLEQVAQDSGLNWSYESRRVAQPILDYLYLGPMTVARNRQWLREQGITMLLAARDAQQAGLNLMAIDRVAQELGIEAQYVDVSGYHELIRAFPSAVRKVNDHMIRIYREQAVDATNVNVQNGAMMIDEANFRRGKVLVFCETGNGRSAGIVAAYLMAVLGMDMVEAYRFVGYKRFCVCMDEDLKHTLKAYEDILLAQRTVHQHEFSFTSSSKLPKKAKRGIDETMDAEGDAGMTGTNQHELLDQDRFLGRDVFVPFVDN
jgi:hypothetical protein